METKEKIKLILKETNPWWKEKAFSLKNYSCRSVFLDIEKFLALPQIIALVGLRRTGKTTLMLKIVENFLVTRIDPANILYFSFDDFSHLEIEEIVSVYRDIFPEADLRKKKFLFCFDEIQKLNDWQEKIKRLYDIYPNIKIIISGSESLFLRKKIKETLAGRIFEFGIQPLDFKEYLYFIQKEGMIKHPRLYQEEIIKLYKEFLKTNGFPELAGVRDDMIIHKYLKESVIDKILFKDIPRLFKVRNPDILADILDIIVFYPGQIIDAVKLSKEMGLARQVISAYLDYLEKSFLVKKLYNFSKNLRKQKRSLKKYYPAIIFPSLVEDKFPLCFENSLVWQLGAQFFYRDAYKNEVDLVLADENKKITPLEIKTGRLDFKGLNSFMKKYKTDEAIILTLDKRESHKQIKVIPFYDFLLK